MTFAACGGAKFRLVSRGASAADEMKLDVVGSEIVTCTWWGCRMKEVRVRVMRHLPSRVLIGRRLMVELGLTSDFASGRGIFYAETSRGSWLFSGVIVRDSSGLVEDVFVVREDNVPTILADMD